MLELLGKVYGVSRFLSGESLRVAVVGLGKMGLLHASILNVLPNVEIVAFCEKSRLLRKFLKNIFDGIRVLDDVEKLSDLGLDAIYITTPIPAHFLVAKTVYLEKIARNLFVEKTLARSHEEAEELCELADSFGGVNMVGYLRRFGVAFRKAKDLLAEDAIGKVSSFRAYAYSSDLLGSEKGSRALSSRGGVLGDLGCHAIDLALWFFGGFQVDSAELTSSNKDGSEDSAHFRARNSSGLEAEFNVSWCMENYRMAEVGFSISGSKGFLEVNDDKLELRLKAGESFTWYRHDLQDNVPFSLGLPEYYREDLHFVESVWDGCSAEPSFYAASKVDKIIGQVVQRAGESE